MLEPLAVDPNRSVVPAANSIASARLVFPAPAGPTSAITRVPLADSPAMRLSLRAVAAPRVASQEGARAPMRKRPPSNCFLQKAREFVADADRSARATPPVAADARRRASAAPTAISRRPHLDLADALAADSVDLAQVLERSSARRSAAVPSECGVRGLDFQRSSAVISRSWRTRLS